MSGDLTAPVDSLHDECLAAQRAIRARYNARKAWAAMWLPRPCPAR